MATSIDFFHGNKDLRILRERDRERERERERSTACHAYHLIKSQGSRSNTPTDADVLLIAGNVGSVMHQPNQLVHNKIIPKMRLSDEVAARLGFDTPLQCSAAFPLFILHEGRWIHTCPHRAGILKVRICQYEGKFNLNPAPSVFP